MRILDEYMSDDEIIEAILDKRTRIVVKKTRLSKLDRTLQAPEVVEYWRNRVRVSEVRRGRAFKNI